MEFNMKNVKFMPLFAALVVAVSLFPVLVHGDANTDAEDAAETTTADIYSSDSDPLVSLSYIEKVVKPEYDKKIKDLTDTVTALKASLDEANKKLTELNTSGTAAEGIGQYEVVFLEQGSKLMAKTPCEIILRTGSAIAVSIISNGLNDITEGTEILNASEIPLYHALLVPRGNDGRGIQITSPDAYVMVRGEYEIVQ